MIEKTVIKTLELPYGQDWLWYPDANVVVLASHLDEAGRERALCELQAQWRRSWIQVVRNDDEPCPTQPFAVPQQLAATLSVEAR